MATPHRDKRRYGSRATAPTKKTLSNQEATQFFDLAALITIELRDDGVELGVGRIGERGYLDDARLRDAQTIGRQ